MEQVPVTKISLIDGKEHKRNMTLPESEWRKVVAAGGNVGSDRFELRESTGTIKETQLIGPRGMKKIKPELTDEEKAEDLPTLRVKAKELKIKGAHLMSQETLLIKIAEHESLSN